MKLTRFFLVFIVLIGQQFPTYAQKVLTTIDPKNTCLNNCGTIISQFYSSEVTSRAKAVLDRIIEQTGSQIQIEFRSAGLRHLYKPYQ